MGSSLSIFIFAISWLTSVSEEVMKLYKVEIKEGEEIGFLIEQRQKEVFK